MFGFGRRKSHRQLAKAELGESLAHLAQAATHAAGGVGATVGPRLHAARGYVSPRAARVRTTAVNGWASTVTTLTPLALAAMDGARQAGTVAREARSKDMKLIRNKHSSRRRRRWSTMTGLLAAGAVAGLVGTLAMRRRRQQDPWDEYDPAPAPDAAPGDLTSSVDAANASPEPVRSPLAETARDRGPAGGEQLSSATGSITASAKQSASKSSEKTESLLSNATASSRNGHT